MSRTIRQLTLALGAALLVAPAPASAQPGRGAPARRPQGDGPVAREGRPGPGAITHLLNARRELDLTARQVAQLDSLERVQYGERQAFAERMRPVRDSIVERARSGQRTQAFRDSIRAQAEARRTAMQPQIDQRRKRDSSLDAAADRVLNDTQRAKVREMVAARRGYERGLRDGRGQRGGPPQGGMRGGMQGGRGGMMRRPQDGPMGPTGPQGRMRGQQGPGAPGGGMPPRRPPAPDQPDR